MLWFPCKSFDTGTLNNRGKINIIRKKMIFVLGLANNNIMKIMESLKNS